MTPDFTVHPEGPLEEPPNLVPPAEEAVAFRVRDAATDRVRRAVELLGREIAVPLPRTLPARPSSTEWMEVVGVHNPTYSMLQTLTETLAARAGVPPGKGDVPHQRGHPRVQPNRARALHFLHRAAHLDRPQWGRVLRLTYRVAETPLWLDAVHDLRFACGYWVPGYMEHGVDPPLLDAAEVALASIPEALQPMSVDEFTLQMLLAGAEAVLMHGISHPSILDAAYEGFAPVIPFNEVVAEI